MGIFRGSQQKTLFIYCCRFFHASPEAGVRRLRVAYPPAHLVRIRRTPAPGIGRSLGIPSLSLSKRLSQGHRGLRQHLCPGRDAQVRSPTERPWNQPLRARAIARDSWTRRSFGSSFDEAKIYVKIGCAQYKHFPYKSCYSATCHR